MLCPDIKNAKVCWIGSAIKQMRSLMGKGVQKGEPSLDFSFISRHIRHEKQLKLYMYKLG